MSHALPDAAPPPGDAGFTLLEVLCAVAVAGFLLSAIGSVVAVTLAGIRSASERVALVAAGRSLLGSLPESDTLRLGTTVGALGGTRWRIDVSPLAQTAVTRPSLADAAPGPAWRPVAINVVMTARSGRSLRLDTIRLIRQTAP